MPHFCCVWGPFKTRHRKREFSGISYSGGGEFFDFRTGIPGGPATVVNTVHVLKQPVHTSLGKPEINAVQYATN